MRLVLEEGREVAGWHVEGPGEHRQHSLAHALEGFELPKHGGTHPHLPSGTGCARAAACRPRCRGDRRSCRD